MFKGRARLENSEKLTALALTHACQNEDGACCLRGTGAQADINSTDTLINQHPRNRIHPHAALAAPRSNSCRRSATTTGRMPFARYPWQRGAHHPGDQRTKAHGCEPQLQLLDIQQPLLRRSRLQLCCLSPAFFELRGQSNRTTHASTWEVCAEPPPSTLRPTMPQCRDCFLLQREHIAISTTETKTAPL